MEITKIKVPNPKNILEDLITSRGINLNYILEDLTSQTVSNFPGFITPVTQYRIITLYDPYTPSIIKLLHL